MITYHVVVETGHGQEPTFSYVAERELHEGDRFSYVGRGYRVLRANVDPAKPTEGSLTVEWTDTL
ncbi:MAG TPA: hypothetical protein VJ689_00700 [Gaiellaceae bacterium]|nr:hypothetical protein [Gaiellaceae bacterium]